MPTAAASLGTKLVGVMPGRELAGQLAPNTAMLVKASHAMHFEWIVEELCKAYD